MVFHKRTYWFPIWRLGWGFGWKKRRQKGGVANRLSCQTGALHQATGAGGTTETCRMMTDEGWRWWEPCPVWRAFVLSSPLSSSVPHSLPPNTPLAQQQPLCLPVTCISTASFFFLCSFSDHQDAGLKESSVKHWPAMTTSCQVSFKALLSPPFGVAITKCECVWSGWWNPQTIPL